MSPSPSRWYWGQRNELVHDAEDASTPGLVEDVILHLLEFPLDEGRIAALLGKEVSEDRPEPGDDTSRRSRRTNTGSSVVSFTNRAACGPPEERRRIPGAQSRRRRHPGPIGRPHPFEELPGPVNHEHGAILAWMRDAVPIAQRGRSATSTPRRRDGNRALEPLRVSGGRPFGEECDELVEVGRDELDCVCLETLS
jgi:hypothetical protein